MAMDEKEQRQFIRFLAREWKNCVRDLLAYQLLVHQLKPHFGGIEELFAELKKSPVVQKKLTEQFGGLDEMLPPVDQDYPEKVIELLAKWKPPGGSPN
jgi:hypothetical protein